MFLFRTFINFKVKQLKEEVAIFTKNLNQKFSLFQKIMGFLALITLISIPVFLYFYFLFLNVPGFLTIVLALRIFVIGWSIRKEVDSPFIIRIGIASLFIAGIDILYMVSVLYQEESLILIGGLVNISTQLDLFGRYLYSGTFIFALIPFEFEKKYGNYYYNIAYFAILVISILSTIFFGVFPDCYRPIEGYTPFMIFSNLIITILLITSILLLYLQKEDFIREIAILILFSLISITISEVSFIFNPNLIGQSNFIGYAFEILSFYFIYIASIQIGIISPLQDLFKQLEIRNNTLTQKTKRSELYQDLFAHDINNIFQNIQLSLKLCNMEKEKIEKYHNVIKNQIAQGKRLIQNIIKLTKLEELKKHLKPVNLNEKIIKAVSFIRESFSNKNIDVEVNMKKDKILVRANEFIEDILKNILMNAIRYNLRDPIEIQIITDTTRTKKKSHCRLEIIDNGMGIPPRRREPILKGEFEKSPDKKGLGIGLSVVDRLIELYDGDMWIENRIEGDYEKGSKFVLILPLSENL